MPNSMGALIFKFFHFQWRILGLRTLTGILLAAIRVFDQSGYTGNGLYIYQNMSFEGCKI